MYLGNKCRTAKNARPKRFLKIVYSKMGVYFNFKFNHLADLLPAAVKAHGNVLRPKTASCKLGLLFLKVF